MIGATNSISCNQRCLMTPKRVWHFAQRLEVLQRKYLWPTVAPVDGGANVTELADIFEVEWEEPVVDVSLVDEELGPWPVIAMLDDDQFRTFDPVADRDSLSEITYSRAFGEILNLVGDLRFPPRPALFSTPPGEPPYAGVLKKGASCVDVACGPRALTRNSGVAGEQAREGDEEPCERGTRWVPRSLRRGVCSAANGAPLLFARLLGARFARPIAGGIVLRDGHPLLGPSKTWRGLASAILFATCVAVLIGLPWQLGALAAACAMVGDCLSSFVKRRFGLDGQARFGSRFSNDFRRRTRAFG